MCVYLFVIYKPQECGGLGLIWAVKSQNAAAFQPNNRKSSCK